MNKNGYKSYFNKPFEYIYNEELKLYNPTFAKIFARQRFRAYANMYIRNVRQQMINENSKCAYCESKNKLQIDHIIPIFKGGLNELSNLQILCSKCNRSKSDKIISL